MGFLTEVPQISQEPAEIADISVQSFYGSALAGSDVSPYEMSEDEVCICDTLFQCEAQDLP